MANQQIIIDIDNHPPGEYLERLHFSLTEILKLTYSVREGDFRESQMLAHWYIADFLQRIVSGAPQIGGDP